MWKILNVIAILITGGAGYVAYLNRDDLKQEKELLSRAKDYREQTQEWYRKAGEAMKEREASRDGLIASREKAEADLAEKEKELAAAVAELEEIKTRMAAKKEELDAKKKVIAELGGFEEAFAKLDALTQSIAGLNESIAGLKQQQAASNAALASTKAKMQDYANLEAWQKSGKMKSLNANVAMVSPEYQFVIIDAGVSRGVVGGAKLDVFRGGSKIADLKVTAIEPNSTSCTIESVTPGESIQPGDTVVVSEESRPTAADAAPSGDPSDAPKPTTPAVPAADAAAEAPADAADMADPSDDPFGGVPSGGLEPEAGDTAPADDAEAPAEGGEAADPFGMEE